VLAIVLATAPAAAPAIVVVIVIVPMPFPITSDSEDEFYRSANNATTTSSFTSGTTNDDSSTASGTSGDVDDSAAADPTDPTGPTAYDDANHTIHCTLLLRDGSKRTPSYIFVCVSSPGHTTGRSRRFRGPAGPVRVPHQRQSRQPKLYPQSLCDVENFRELLHSI